MKGFVEDIESIAVKNAEFRRVLYTAKNCQLVVMTLNPKEEIGAEVHTLDQFFRVEERTGEAILDGTRTAIEAGFAVFVPAGAKHNIIMPMSLRGCGTTHSSSVSISRHSRATTNRVALARGMSATHRTTSLLSR